MGIRSTTKTTGDVHERDAVNAGAPANSLSHLEGIDGIRAIAAVAVFATHWAALTPLGGHSVFGIWWSQLNIGVSIFFVLSGFLLYRPFVGSAMGGGARPRLVPFMVRRAFRIYPAYWVALGFDMWLGWQLRLKTNIGWLTNITLTDDYFQNAEPTSGLPQSWTLAAEVGFYVFLPLFVVASGLILRRFRPGVLLSLGAVERRLRNQLVGLLVLGLGSMALATFGKLPSAIEAIDIGDFEVHPFSFIRWLGMFAAGMVLALASTRERDHDSNHWFQAAGRHPVRCWLGAFALLAILNEFIGIEVGDGADVIQEWQWAVRHLFHIAIAVLLILPAITRGDPEATSPDVVRRFLAHPVMVVLGTASYGIYLWHYGILVFLGREWLTDARTGDVMQILLLGAVGLALTVAFGWLSYHLVEAPARVVARKLTGRRQQPINR